MDGNDDDDKATPAARTARIISLQRALLDKPNARSFKIGIAADLSVGQRCMYLSALQMAKADDLADIDVFKLRDVALLSRILPKSSGRHFPRFEYCSSQRLGSVSSQDRSARSFTSTCSPIIPRLLLCSSPATTIYVCCVEYQIRLRYCRLWRWLRRRSCVIRRGRCWR